MATKTKVTWTDYAFLQSSDGKQNWKVQINEEGRFRCSCPSFIFYKGEPPRTCKHCRRCETERQQELRSGVVRPQARVLVNPHMAEATSILSAMLKEAGLIVRPGAFPTTVISNVQEKKMRELLAARLAVYLPPETAPAEEHNIGVRRIVFDD